MSEVRGTVISPNTLNGLMSNRELPVKRSLFVQEYVKDFNGTKAAIRAGYSPASAHVEASRLLRNPKVAEAIDREMSQIASSEGITRDGIISQLSRIANDDSTPAGTRVSALRVLASIFGMLQGGYSQADTDSPLSKLLASMRQVRQQA